MWWPNYGLNKRRHVDASAIQSAHTGFVPRVGGIAIYCSIVTMFPISYFYKLDLDYLIWLIISTLPIFIIGLAEDLGYQMSPKIRLLAAVFSGIIVLVSYGFWVTRLEIPGLDFFMSYAPFGIAMTLFATTGVVNAFNLIDGINGLSSYIAISTAMFLSILSYQVEHYQLACFYVLFMACVLGFACLNFPFGKVFLGDAGAYTLGHLLVWSAIILFNYSDDISPFAILLIFFWPVADTGLAIWRRWKLGYPTDKPDRLHFHQLTMRFLEIRFFGRRKRKIANPMATIILVPLISFPQFLGATYWKDINMTIWSTICVSLLFIGTYIIGINFTKRF